MSVSEFYTVLGVGIPIFIVFAILTLTVLCVQAYQIAKQEEIKVAKRAAIGGLSFAVSILATVSISFFVGIYVAALLMVVWFIIAASMPNFAQSGVGIISGLFLSAIPVIIIVVIIGIVFGIWPLTVLIMQGYKIVKHKQSRGAKVGTVVFARFRSRMLHFVDLDRCYHHNFGCARAFRKKARLILGARFYDTWSHCDWSVIVSYEIITNRNI